MGHDLQITKLRSLREVISLPKVPSLSHTFPSCYIGRKVSLFLLLPQWKNVKIRCQKMRQWPRFLFTIEKTKLFCHIHFQSALWEVTINLYTNIHNLQHTPTELAFRGGALRMLYIPQVKLGEANVFHLTESAPSEFLLLAECILNLITKAWLKFLAHIKILVPSVGYSRQFISWYPMVTLIPKYVILIFNIEIIKLLH